MAVLTTSGIPANTVGTTGDYAIDPVAHIIYGPKTTTWSGTASSLQGPSGPGLVYGNGAPTSGQGAIGQGYLDLLTGNFYGPKASNGAWGSVVSKIQGAAGISALSGAGSPTSNNVIGVEGQSYLDTVATVLYIYKNGGWSAGTSLIGAAGAPGASTLTSQSAGLAQAFVYLSTVSTTPVLGVYPGSTVTYPYVPSYGTSLMGLTYCNNAATAVTLTLYDQTAATSIWSGSATANAAGSFGQFDVGQYPMPANHTYVWRLTSASSNTANIYVQPIYLFPSASNVYNVCSLVNTSLINYAFSATVAATNVSGTNNGLYFQLPKASNVYSLTINSTNASALTLKVMGPSAVLTLTVPPNAITNFGPYAAGTYPLAAKTTYYYTVTGSGTGSIFVDMQILSTIA